MKKLLLPTLLAFGALALNLHAGDAYPDSYHHHHCGCHVTSVNWIQANQNNLEYDNNKVTVIGKIIEKEGDDYIFSDGTGRIELDSDIDLPLGKEIAIHGRIDEAYLHIGPLQIDVDGWNPVWHKGRAHAKN